MSNKKEYFDLGELGESIRTDDKQPLNQTLEIKDASSETAKILVPQMGSDAEKMQEGKIDWRRFTHLEYVDPFWMTYLKLMPKERGGNFASKFVEEYGNLQYSVGGRHKKLVVDMQRAVSGDRTESKKSPKKRSITDRILGRNKQEDD